MFYWELNHPAEGIPGSRYELLSIGYSLITERLFSLVLTIADREGVGLNRLQFTIRKSTSLGLSPAA